MVLSLRVDGCNYQAPMLKLYLSNTTFNCQAPMSLPVVLVKHLIVRHLCLTVGGDRGSGGDCSSGMMSIGGF